MKQRKLRALKPALIFLLLLIYFWPSFAQKAPSFQPCTGWGTTLKSNRELILLRKLNRAGRIWYLAVDPLTLETRILDKSSLARDEPVTWDWLRSHFSSSAYIRAMKEAEDHSNSIQDAGLSHLSRSQAGIDLTIDLCPSHRPLDKIVFADLIAEFGKIEKPVPVAISVTGLWMNKHTSDLKWLDSLDKAGVLSVVWINHTYHHTVLPHEPLNENFMLAPGTDVNAEILKTEEDLIHHGIVPSVFFRFPGLVSDHTIFEKIVSLGLIPVGTDAWFAKGQKPAQGSIVLIHANGNEPVGVKDFINLLRSEENGVLSKRWELFDLRESIEKDTVK